MQSLENLGMIFISNQYFGSVAPVGVAVVKVEDD